MLAKLRDAMTAQVPNVIMPLFWQKGAGVEAVREEMERIADAGIGAVILEARPHPEFLQEGWWRDVDAVIDIARRRNMKVWFFDDDIFPTGHAAGAMESADPQLRRRFLVQRHTDVVGPAVGASLIVDRKLPWSPTAQQDAGELIRVIAYPRAEDSDKLVGDPIDITDRVTDGIVYWDIPDGWWKVFFISVSTDCGSDRQMKYIDYLSRASTRLLIDSVHERTYERYGDDFGSTIAGFFSDEPGLYNDPDTFDFNSALGKAVPLPWNDAVLERLSLEVEGNVTTLLPLLWYSANGAEKPLRYAYMNVVTELYSENFSQQLGSWCREHGVEYIGHVLEDNGVHARLGSGTGHYFRAMAGQDMAGIDIIGGQVIPGFARGPFGNLSGAADGEFFHFGLAKLASSAAHIDPLKHGRSMCETIGAYGWYAGLRLFTWLTNHLLVRGVTHVVPHAFSPAPFPDPDCPPHFYAHGHNPQFRHQHHLSAYTNRISHLLSGGQHIAPFAVLYHADAEWLGTAMPVERPLRLLMEAQLDADVIPADSLAESTLRGTTLLINEEHYDALVVPGSDFLPEWIAGELLRLDAAGIAVIFVDVVPKVVGESADILQKRFLPVPQKELIATMSGLTSRAVSTANPAPFLRAYRVNQGEADVVMLVNESVRDAIQTSVTIPRAGQVVAFDAFTGKASRLSSRDDKDAVTFDVDLAPGAAEVLIVGSPSAWAGLPVTAGTSFGRTWSIETAWKIGISTAGQYPVFTHWDDLNELVPLNAPDLLPRFSGTVLYTGSFRADQLAGDHRLDLGKVYETAQVRINGVDLGTRISPPYVFQIPDGLLAPKNTIEVEVTNTLAKSQADVLSAFAQQEPTGLLGPVTLAQLVPHHAEGGGSEPVQETATRGV